MIFETFTSKCNRMAERTLILIVRDCLNSVHERKYGCSIHNMKIMCIKINNVYSSSIYVFYYDNGAPPLTNIIQLIIQNI